MRSKIMLTAVAVSGLLLSGSTVNAQKWEDLAKTPPMGWSSWNKFGGNINENSIREIADAMVSSGLADCGDRKSVV